MNTTNTTYLEVFLRVRTNASAPFFLPVIVNIVKFPTEKFNKKPEFLVPEDITVNFTLNYFAYTYEIPMNITEQFDDHNKLSWLNISNRDLGFLKIKYDNNTQVPRLYRYRKDMLVYDDKNFTLIGRFEGGPEEMYNKWANVIYRIKVVVEDYLGLKSEKLIQLNITVNETWYREWLNRNWRPPDVE